MSPDQRARKLDGMIKDAEQARSNLVSQDASDDDLARCDKRLAGLRSERAAISASRPPTRTVYAPAATLARTVAKADARIQEAAARESAATQSLAPQGFSMITIAQLKAANPGLEAAIDRCVLTGSTPDVIAATLRKSEATAAANGASAGRATPEVLTRGTPTDQKVASEFSAADDAEVLRLARSLCTENRRARDCIAAINVAQAQIGLELDTRARADERLSRELEQSKLGLAMKGSDVNSLQREISRTTDQRAATYHASMVAGIDARIADLRAAQRQFFAELRRYVPIGLT